MIQRLGLRGVRVRPLVAGLVMLLAPALLFAQRTLPTPEQAQILLQTRPDLVERLRAEMARSGLTPEQIRARLRAEGYPDNMLDQFLPGSTGAAAPGAPTSGRVLDAVRQLGIVDQAELDSIAGFGSGFGLGFGGDSLAGRQRLQQEIACDSLASSIIDLDSARIAALSSDSMRNRLIALARCPSDRRSLAGPADSGFVVFGHALFGRATSQFDPNLAGPVDENYRLGPGDRIVLILTGDVEEAQTLDVTREGFVVIPRVGQIQVANLTLGQLEDLLYSRLGRVYSGVRRGAGATTRFSVSVARLRSNQVFVVGDVVRPASYRVSSAGTALTALYAAGGPSRAGSLRRVEVRRGTQTVSTLDVYDYLLRGDASHDVRLQTGDILFVPTHGPLVRVVGEVGRPATYELKTNETLTDVIQYAGGFTPLAARRSVQIERILPPSERREGGRDRVVLDVPAPDPVAAGGGSPTPMIANDVVRVFRVSDRVRNRISVVGNVWAPGQQGWTPGMKVSDALEHAGGVKPDVYLGQILISRLQPDSARTQLRASLRDTSGAVVGDIPLLEDDEIRVFSVAQFRPERYVAISGAVRRGGRFPYREGMTMRDLVLEAGGLHESAFLTAAEIARLPENRAAGATAVTIRVPLDSTYLFERSAGERYLGPPGLAAPSGAAPDVPLNPYDNVLILRQPNWELQRTVVVTGEVQFPGRYSLVNKNERLADVIRRAGAFTTSAYAAGVVFVRPQNGLGRIGVDLPRAMANAGFRDNLILQDGDSIFVPAYNGVVNVRGAVNSPVAVAYVPGRRIDFYIGAAGGGTVKADEGRAYVTQPNGKVESVHRHRFFPDASPAPLPGSSVFVPERDPSDRSNAALYATAAAQILGSLVAIVAVIVARR